MTKTEMKIIDDAFGRISHVAFGFIFVACVCGFIIAAGKFNLIELSVILGIGALFGYITMMFVFTSIAIIGYAGYRIYAFRHRDYQLRKMVR